MKAIIHGVEYHSMAESYKNMLSLFNAVEIKSYYYLSRPEYYAEIEVNSIDDLIKILDSTECNLVIERIEGTHFDRKDLSGCLDITIYDDYME